MGNIGPIIKRIIAEPLGSPGTAGPDGGEQVTEPSAEPEQVPA